jgi:ribonucleoside-diphosphate reductase alpha chain
MASLHEPHDERPDRDISDEQPTFEQLTLEVESLRTELHEARFHPSRRRLPDTRNSITHKFNISGHEGYITVGLYDDESPGEVFLVIAKEGSTLRGMMDTVAVLTSLALQYGVPVEDLARKFEHSQFEPSGDTTNPEIRIASSITDYIFRWIGLRFSKTYRDDCAARASARNPAEPSQEPGEPAF